MKSLNAFKGALGSLAASLIVVLMFASTAAAQDGRSQINIQGIGVIINDSTGQAGSQDVTRSGGFLVGYTRELHRWAGVEGVYGFTRNTHYLTGSGGSLNVRSNIDQITGAFVLNAPSETMIVRPYALAGGGVLVFDPRDDVGITAVDQQTRPAFLYGGGLNFNVVRNLGVRAEYRGFVYKSPDFKTGTFDIDTFSHLAQPSVGIYFRF